MGDNQNQSYSLLTQEEIDVLVTFLNAKKSSLNSDVLNQTSVDKLIYLITNDRQQIVKDLFDPLANVNSALLETLNFKKNTDELCELRCELAEDTGMLKLIIFNTVTEKMMEITPKMLDESDIAEWGNCISPAMFNRIARALSLKYTTETHNKICALFAKATFGDETHTIPNLHMPRNAYLIEVMLP